MNKCILCTFLKMIWDGLFNNTCPSVDENKEEKKAPGPQVLGETFLLLAASLALTGLLVLILYLLLSFIAWLLGVSIAVLFQWITLFVLAPGGLIFAVLVAIELTKIRIACIKAYWRKAKEACE